jgi:hypothetical protein
LRSAYRRKRKRAMQIIIKIMTSTDIKTPHNLSHARAYAHAARNKPMTIRIATQSSILLPLDVWDAVIS